LSRCNQLNQSTVVYSNLVAAYPEDATLSETSESALRPLSRLAPELQIVTWELIKHLEERPVGATIQQVVSTIRGAIESGWEARSAPSKGRNAATHRTHRQSDQLGALCRWVNRVTSWDPQMIAAADDELRLKAHLKAARQLRAFCEALIQTLEERLATNG
jgi:hypothetical protein